MWGHAQVLLAEAILVPAQHHGQFVLVPARVPVPRVADGFGPGWRPGRATTPPGSRRTIFQKGKMLRIIARGPAIVRRARDPEVAAGRGHGAGPRVVQELQPQLGIAAQGGERWGGDRHSGASGSADKRSFPIPPGRSDGALDE